MALKRKISLPLLITTNVCSVRRERENVVVDRRWCMGGEEGEEQNKGEGGGGRKIIISFFKYI